MYLLFTKMEVDEVELGQLGDKENEAIQADEETSFVENPPGQR